MSEHLEIKLRKIEKVHNDINALFDAALKNNDKNIKTLLKNGVNINVTDCCDAYKTVLIKICSRDKEDKEYDIAAKLLLENGADPNILYWGCDNLLGSDVFYSTNTINTAFTFACYLGHKKIVKLMLDKYVDVSKPESCAGDALQKSVYCNQIEIVNMLLDAGVDINYINEYRLTPLAIACIYGRDKMVRCLIDRGANININIPQYQYCNKPPGDPVFNFFSTEPLLIAIKHAGENIMKNSKEIIELLEQNGA